MELIPILRTALHPLRSHRRLQELEAEIKETKRLLKESEAALSKFQRQAFSLREWIRVAHRLDKVPDKGTIQDILRKP